MQLISMYGLVSIPNSQLCGMLYFTRIDFLFYMMILHTRALRGDFPINEFITFH